MELSKEARRLLKEISEDAEEVELKKQRDGSYFAYPVGAVSGEVVNELEATGYLACRVISFGQTICLITEAGRDKAVDLSEGGFEPAGLN